VLFSILEQLVTTTDNFKNQVNTTNRQTKLKPNEDRIIYGIAASQYGVGQYDKSLANCKTALQLNKDNDNAKQLFQMLSGKTK